MQSPRPPLRARTQLPSLAHRAAQLPAAQSRSRCNSCTPVTQLQTSPCADTATSSSPGNLAPPVNDVRHREATVRSDDLICDCGNRRRVGRMGDLTETTRKILLPTVASANWRCSECAWSQPFVRRQELIPDVPTKAIEDAFNRHKCTEHRHPKWGRQIT